MRLYSASDCRVGRSIVFLLPRVDGALSYCFGFWFFSKNSLLFQNFLIGGSILDSVVTFAITPQVYVAGWKQREHPYLHNTFHLGDRIISISGVQVTSAAEAHNTVKNEESLLVSTTDWMKKKTSFVTKNIQNSKYKSQFISFGHTSMIIFKTFVE